MIVNKLHIYRKKLITVNSQGKLKEIIQIPQEKKVLNLELDSKATIDKNFISTENSTVFYCSENDHYIQNESQLTPFYLSYLNTIRKGNKWNISKFDYSKIDIYSEKITEINVQDLTSVPQILFRGGGLLLIEGDHVDCLNLYISENKFYIEKDLSKRKNKILKQNHKEGISCLDFAFINKHYNGSIYINCSVGILNIYAENCNIYIKYVTDLLNIKCQNSDITAKIAPDAILCKKEFNSKFTLF